MPCEPLVIRSRPRPSEGAPDRTAADMFSRAYLESTISNLGIPRTRNIFDGERHPNVMARFSRWPTEKRRPPWFANGRVQTAGGVRQ